MAGISCRKWKITLMETHLVGGFNPSENISQIGSFPQVGLKKKNIQNHHPVPVILEIHPFSTKPHGLQEEKSTFLRKP